MKVKVVALTASASAGSVYGVSIIDQHSSDIASLLIWALVIMSGAFFTLLAIHVNSRLTSLDERIASLDGSLRTQMAQMGLRTHALELEQQNQKVRMDIMYREKEK